MWRSFESAPIFKPELKQATMKIYCSFIDLLQLLVTLQVRRGVPEGIELLEAAEKRLELIQENPIWIAICRGWRLFHAVRYSECETLVRDALALHSGSLFHCFLGINFNEFHSRADGPDAEIAELKFLLSRCISSLSGVSIAPTAVSNMSMSALFETPQICLLSSPHFCAWISLVPPQILVPSKFSAVLCLMSWFGLNVDVNVLQEVRELLMDAVKLGGRPSHAPALFWLGMWYSTQIEVSSTTLLVLRISQFENLLRPFVKNLPNHKHMLKQPLLLPLFIV